ncbi:MAG: hypothetical protein O3B02_06325 [Proteobacteria bacterium]|nr:hypothetical protein [Pseudomonadota bacterium]
MHNTGGHSIFTDRTMLSGPETSARIKAATEELYTIFLRRSLDSGDSPVSTERITAGSAMGANPAAQTDAHAVQQGLSRWAYRHKDLLDRFTSRQT